MASAEDSALIAALAGPAAPQRKASGRLSSKSNLKPLDRGDEPGSNHGGSQDGDGAGRYEVEVRRGDGSEVEIHLNGSFEQVGSAANDDSGEGADDDGDEGSGSGK